MIEKSLEAARFVHRGLILGCAALLVFALSIDQVDYATIVGDLRVNVSRCELI